MGVIKIAGKRPARFKWTKRIGIVLIIYTIVGFFIVPAIIKWQMVKRLPALTKRQAAITQVKVNPYALSLTIRGFSLKEPDGEVFTSFDEFYINFELWASLFKRSWVFKEISLKKPFAQVTYKEDGTFNFANLLEPGTAQPAKPEKPPGLPPSITVYHMMVTNGSVAIADLKHNPQFRTEFVPIDLNLTNLATIRNNNSPYSFLARTGTGESFSWAGTVGVTPPRSTGQFRLGGLKLSTYSAYSHDFARFDIADGVLDIAADYRLAITTNSQDLEVSNAAIHLTNLKLKDPDTGEMLVSIPLFSIMQTDASVEKHNARVGIIKSSGGSILVKQSHDGTLNLLSMLKLPKTITPKTSKPVEPAAAWTAKIDEIAFDDYAIKVEDKKPAKPAHLGVDQLAFNIKNISNVTNAPVTVSLSLRYQETGNIGVSGIATVLPPSADLQIGLTNLDLRPIEPYVAEQVKLAITSGSLNLNGRAHYASPEPNAPLISFTGDLALNKFTTTDDVLFKDFLKWESLNVDGIKVQLKPDKLSADQVKFTHLNTSAIVGPDGRVNLQNILRDKMGVTNVTVVTVPSTNKAAPAPKTAKATPAKPAAPLPDIALGALVFENASFHLSDQSLEPHCTFDVQEFSGSIKGLSSQPNTTAVIDFKGKVDDRSPFSLTGRVNPLASNIFLDATVNFTNTELTPFTPYMEKFAGRPLQKGKFSMSVHYSITNKLLKAENGFYIDQLTLGPKNNSTNATKLPVKLAVNLLKDRNGRIKLDVPVAGRMDDPKFAVGPIIRHVIYNLIEKAALSPFSLLGSAFGAGDELSFVQFEPGRAVIPNSETNKLETLAKSLFAHPALSLEINGSVDAVNERVPLARAKLDDQIKSLWIKEQTDSGKQSVSLAEVNLDEKENEKLIRRLYKTTFGRYKPSELSNNAGGGIGSAAALLATMPPPAKSDHGSSSLVKPRQALGPAEKATPTAPIAGKKQTGPLTREELELADMEDQLVSRIAVSNDDLRNLMQARAAKVQAYLLKSEKVTADRLFIIAPKPIDKSFKGESKATLSLD